MTSSIETRVITVTEANKTPDWKSNPAYVYIGRDVFHQSLKDIGWGNPFVIGKTHPDSGLPLSREEAIDLYEEWAVKQLDSYQFRQRLYHLHGKILVCWCAPKPCHGGVLKRLAESVYHHTNEQIKVWEKQPSLVGYREQVEKERF